MMARAVLAAMARGDTCGREEGVLQAGFSMAEEAAHPLAHSRHANAVRCAGGGEGQLALDDVLDHFESTDDGEPGILVDVHSAESLKRCGLGRTSQSLKLSPNEQ